MELKQCDFIEVLLTEEQLSLLIKGEKFKFNVNGTEVVVRQPYPFEQQENKRDKEV